MLLELHVKNLALIETADVELEDGLNILTGETGAGKSYHDRLGQSGIGAESFQRDDPKRS